MSILVYALVTIELDAELSEISVWTFVTSQTRAATFARRTGATAEVIDTIADGSMARTSWRGTDDGVPVFVKCTPHQVEICVETAP